MTREELINELDGKVVTLYETLKSDVLEDYISIEITLTIRDPEKFLTALFSNHIPDNIKTDNDVLEYFYERYDKNIPTSVFGLQAYDYDIQF